MDDQEYFRDVEEYFKRKRGNPWPLSSKELKLIDEWLEARVPFEVVARGIDRAFERKPEKEGKDPVSLLYCRRLVKSEHKKHLKSMEGTASTAGAAPDAANVEQYLTRLADSLGKSAAQASDSGNDAFADFLRIRQKTLVDTILVPFQQKTVPDLQRVEQQLTDLEKEIEAVLLTVISEDRIVSLKEEAMRELKTFEGKLELTVYQEMIRRALIKSVRKLFSIPRLSLFYM